MRMRMKEANKKVDERKSGTMMESDLLGATRMKERVKRELKERTD